MISKMSTVALALAGLIPAATLSAQNSAQRSIPITSEVSAVLATPLPQSKVANCTDATQTVPWKGNVTLHYSQQGLEVQGRDLSGHFWSTVTPASNVMKCEVWAANLRSGFPEDLIFLTADEMGGYASELTILFFDKSGRPHPWQTRGAFSSTNAGIQQLAVNKSTKNAELIVPVREGDKSSGFVYVHNLYRMTPEGVSKIVSSEVGNSWPSISGNQNALVGTENKVTESDTFSSGVTPQVASQLKLTEILPSSNDEPLVYSDGTKTRFPSIAVLDKSDGSRRIYFDSDTPDAINEIHKGSYSVQLKGSTCEEEECRPFILIAKQQ